MGFPGGSDGKESAGSIPELGRPPGEGNGNPVQYSFLENSMDRGAWKIQSTGTAGTLSTITSKFFGEITGRIEFV